MQILASCADPMKNFAGECLSHHIAFINPLSNYLFPSACCCFYNSLCAAVIYLVDISECPDFNTMYELYDPCTVMFFFRNKVGILLDVAPAVPMKPEICLQSPWQLSLHAPAWIHLLLCCKGTSFRAEVSLQEATGHDVVAKSIIRLRF